MRYINQNYIRVSGTLTEGVTFSHEVHGIKMYTGTIEVTRKSGVIDKLPITLSEGLKSTIDPYFNCDVTIIGEIRTYNKHVDDKSKLLISIFVKEITVIKDELFENNVELEGFICKEPIYRETPFNKQICDLLIAVNRDYNKSNYIPVICWGTTAANARELPVGTRVMINGRLQSREYNKNGEIKTAYELSANSVEEINTLPDEFEPLEEIDL